MLDIILNSMKMVGSDLPAYKAIFDSVVKTLSETDQAEAKAEYERTLERADAAHKAAQAL